MPITYEDSVEQMEQDEVTPSTDGRYATQMPDLEDTGAVQHWLEELEEHKNIFGVKKLLNSVKMVLEHQRLKDQHYQTALKAVQVVNGIRTPSQRQADRSKGLEATARKFYTSLNETGLRLQCQLFQVDYDSFHGDTHGIIEALVAKHMEMQAA